MRNFIAFWENECTTPHFLKLAPIFCKNGRMGVQHPHFFKLAPILCSVQSSVPHGQTQDQNKAYEYFQG